MPCSGANDQGGATGLTSREIDAIRQSWKQVNTDPESVGVELLVRLFKGRPSTQLYFNKFGDMTEEKLRDSTAVRDHAVNVMQGVTSLVSNLDNDQHLIESLGKLSSDHHGQGVQSQDFRFILNLLQAMMKESLGKEYDVFTAESWKKCCDVIWSVIDNALSKQT